MITKTKIIKDINYIRDDTPVAFKNFGGFFLKLMMLPVKDQEFIVDNLRKAAKQITLSANIVIHFIRRVEITRDSELKFRFILEYGLKCKYCNQACKEETNICNGKFRDICESCMDKIQDYAVDRIETKND